MVANPYLNNKKKFLAITLNNMRFISSWKSQEYYEKSRFFLNFTLGVRLNEWAQVQRTITRHELELERWHKSFEWYDHQLLSGSKKASQRWMCLFPLPRHQSGISPWLLLVFCISRKGETSNDNKRQSQQHNYYVETNAEDRASLAPHMRHTL